MFRGEREPTSVHHSVHLGKREKGPSYKGLDCVDTCPWLELLAWSSCDLDVAVAWASSAFRCTLK